MKSDYFRCKTNNHKVCRDTFENIGELAEYLKTAPTSSTFNGHSLSSKKPKDPHDDFNDFNSLEEAMNNLEYGCDKFFVEFKDNLRKAKDFIRKKEVQKTGNFKNDIVGFVPIVPNAIIGNPINMINQNIKKKQVPIMRLIVDKAVLCGVSVEDNLRYYSMVFALIEVLEQKGIRVELWECGASGEDEEIYAHKLKLKDYMQPLNIYKLQFPIISVDMHRRIGFRLKETCEGLKDHDWTWGYGGTLISRDLPYYNLTKDGEPNEGMKEILDITDQDVYIPNVEYMKCRNRDYEYILEKLLKETNLKKYLKIT